MNRLIQLLPPSLLAFLRKKLLGKGKESTYTRPFYSQCGEDIMLAQVAGIIGLPKQGFFIDVGAYHPFHSSNTFMLYQSGWHGINIDPNPGAKSLFDKYRSADINLSVGISRQKGNMDYYMLSDTSSMNTFSKENLKTLGLIDQVQKIVQVETLPLHEVINKYVSPGMEIDFLNVDAEGYEMEVLNSIDWNFKQPKIIALEQNYVTGMEEVLASEAALFLKEHHYIPVAKTMITETVSTIFYIKKRN